MSTWTPERRIKLEALLADGYSFAQAAKRLGVPRGSVCWATARYGINRAPDPNVQPDGREEQSWETRLTERWADRKKRVA